jgi:hypothetical protein
VNYRIPEFKLQLNTASEVYDTEKYLEMLLDSAEAVLSIFRFNRSSFGFDKKRHWWDELNKQHENSPTMN